MRDQTNHEVNIDAVCVDANWNLVADSVYQFCRENATKYFPCHGKGIGASMMPMSDWAKKAGVITHKANWQLRTATLGANRGRNISFDTNFWKSRIGERLVTHVANPNAIQLWGKSQTRHLMASEHLASEVPCRTYGKGRSVDEWKRKPTSENHLFDCLVLAAIAASKCGLELLELTRVDSTSSETVATAIPNKERRVAAAPPQRKEY